MHLLRCSNPHRLNAQRSRSSHSRPEVGQSAATTVAQNPNLSRNSLTVARRLSRREWILSGLAIAQISRIDSLALESTLQETLRSYKDPAGRYTISIPASWIESEKPGAQVLFKDDQTPSSNLGITINPVKIPSLEKFGSVEEIGERLLQVERQKDGFIDLKLLDERSQTIKQDVSYNIYTYDLDTTRGKKSVVTGVTIDGFRLFIVNGQCKSNRSTDFERLKAAVTSFALL